MFKRMIIYSEDDRSIEMYRSFLGKFDILEFRKMSAPDFTAMEEVSIKSLPTTFSERWGSYPYEFDCMIIDPGKEMNCLVTTIPNFGRWMKKFNKLEYAILLFEIPLYKVIEYSLNRDEEMVYGIHDKFSFACELKVNKKLVKQLGSSLERILSWYKLIELDY